MTSQVHKRQQQRWSAAGPEVVARQERVLAELTEGRSVDEATASVGVTVSAYKKWRDRNPEFRTRADRIINARRLRTTTKPRVPFDADFRRRYLGQGTPDHQRKMMNLINGLGAGEWGLILAPPEHAKTSTTEDFLTHAIAMDPNIRCLIISKTEGHAKKVLGTVRERLTNFDAYEDLIAHYGPFKGRPWTANHFTVAGKDSGERDYTLDAVGMKGQVYGRRVDVIVLDDPIDLDNAAQHEDQLEWLQLIVESRLNSDHGIGIVLGTRIREVDLYDRLIEEGWIHKSEILPAVIREPGTLTEDDPGESLWPDRWPVEKLLKKRERMKARTWALSYQQQKLQPGDAVFPLPMIESCFDPTLSRPQGNRLNDTVSIVGIDPGLARVTAAFTINLDRATKIRHWADLRTITNIGEGGDVQEALINFIVDTVKVNRACTCVVEGNSAFKLLTSSRVLREKLRELYCNLIVVTSEGEGLKAENKWQTDRPELTYETLAPLFANKLYKIPASAGAQKFFRPAINQLENYPGSKRSPKDILSAVRLAEFGCLSVLERFHPPAKTEKSYGEAMARLQERAHDNRIPAYVMKPHLRHLKEKAMAQRNARAWGPDGVLGRRLPSRGPANEQETA